MMRNLRQVSIHLIAVIADIEALPISIGKFQFDRSRFRSYALTSAPLAATVYRPVLDEASIRGLVKFLSHSRPKSG